MNNSNDTANTTKTCADDDCTATATHGDYCRNDAAIHRYRIECEARRCKPTCTRGACWRKTTRNK